MRALFHRLLSLALSLSLALTPAAEAAFHTRIDAAGGVNFDTGSPITIGAYRDPFINAAHPAGWLGDGESGHMALADTLLGLSPPEDPDPTDEADPSDWRIDLAAYGVEAALPTGSGYEYLSEVAARTDTTLEEIILLDYSHFEVERQLSPAFKALLTIVITQGMGLGGAFNLAGNLGLVTTNAAGVVSLTALGTAVNAFAVSLSVGVIDAAVSGDLDLGEILEGAVFAGVTAGLTAGINANDLGITLGEGAGVSLLGVGNDFTLAALVEGGIDAVIKAGLNSAVYGTDFGDALLDSLAATVTSALLADVQTLIGDQGLAEGSAGHMLLHGLAGCAFNEASGADCVAGFAAGVVGSLYAGYLHENGIGADDPAIGEHLNTAELLGAFAGYVFSSGKGENVSLGGQVSQSGVENNYLYHEEAAEKRELEEFLANCSGGSVTCTEAEISAAESRIAELEALDQLRDAILITACAGGPMGSNAQLCMLASQDAQAAANSYIMAGALDAFEAEFLKAAYLGNAGTFGDNPDLQIFLHGIDLGSIAGAVIATLALGGPVAARCAINPVCRAEAATAVADAIGAGYSGSITLIPAVGAVGGKLVLQAGDEILAVLDDTGRLFTPLSQEVDDAGRFLVQASDGTVGYLDEAGRFVQSGRFTGDFTKLTPAERAVVERELAAGRNIEMIPTGTGRTADFYIDGVKWELKTISNVQNTTSDGISKAMSSTIMDARGQSSHIIVDMTGQSGVTEEIARRGIDRAIAADLNIPSSSGNVIQSIRVIGPDFDITVVGSVE